MAVADAPRCQYKQGDGKQCGRPALSRLRYCDFHQRQHKRNARQIAERNRQRWFESVKLSDQKSVQMALQKILQLILDGEIDLHRAGQLIYRLQGAIVERQKREGIR